MSHSLDIKIKSLSNYYSYEKLYLSHNDYQSINGDGYGIVQQG